MLVFVLLALGVLVAVPILVERRVGDLREQVEAAEAARGHVSALESNLTREMLALSEALLSQDTAAVADYDSALAREDSIYRDLDAAIHHLGPEIAELYANVRRQALIWHDRAPDASDLLEEYGDVAEPRPRRERRLFEELLVTNRVLDNAIIARSAELRGRINTIERQGLLLTFVLGFLALIVGIAAALLAGRSRRYAVQSEHRRMEAEIALEKLAREAELRQRLLQGITHDVKNPLGAAKGYAELLAMGVKAPILPEQLPLITGVQRSVDGALQIIADLLDVARADGGRLSVERVPTDLCEVVGETVEAHRAQAEMVGHSLIFERPGSPVRVHTDPARVNQILQNLISNAFKYTPSPGTIRVDTQLRAQESGGRERTWAVVRVRDTGPGIPPAMRERIFDEFSRLSDDGPVEGHGLGLAIARRIARLLGGDLRVEESGEPGATFVLLLPVRESGDGAGTSASQA